jgi:hypothetical protein
VLLALREDDLCDARLRAYAERVAAKVGVDMALARMVTHVIANRTLNGVWLGYLRHIVARARRDPAYSYAMGGMMSGVMPVRGVLAGSVVIQAFAGFIAQQRGVAEVVGAAVESGLAMVEHRDATLRWARGSSRSCFDLLTLARDSREYERRLE